MIRYRMSISAFRENVKGQNNLFLNELEFDAAHIIEALSIAQIRLADYQKWYADFYKESGRVTFVVFLSQRLVWKKFPFSRIEGWRGVHCFIDQQTLISANKEGVSIVDVTLDLSQSDSEMRKKVLELQCDAFTRAFVLMREKDNVTFDDVMRLLADAEREAQYVCGFVGLEGDTGAKTTLLAKLLGEKLIQEDTNGHIILTARGEKRGKEESLPPEIEQHIPAD